MLLELNGTTLQLLLCNVIYICAHVSLALSAMCMRRQLAVQPLYRPLPILLHFYNIAVSQFWKNQKSYRSFS